MAAPKQGRLVSLLESGTTSMKPVEAVIPLDGVTKKEFAGNPSYNRVGGGIYLSHNGNKQSSDGSVSYGETYGTMIPSYH